MSGDSAISTISDLVFCDMEREFAATRRVLERVPDEHLQWKPHERSMTLEKMAGHVATMPIWCALALEQDVLDFASPPSMPREFRSRDALVAVFDEYAAKTLAALQRTDDAAMLKTWQLRNGEQVMFSEVRGKVLRVWSVNHMIHHRGQLCLYLRLLGVPVPRVYFNSADEPEMKFD